MRRLRKAAWKAGQIHNLCECGGALLVRYDLDKLREGWSREWIPDRAHGQGMWRYALGAAGFESPPAMISLGERHDPSGPHQTAGRAPGQ